MQNAKEAGEMAQAMKGLLCNHKDPSSSPRTHTKRKKLGMVACTCNPALGCGQGDPWDSVASQSSLMGQLQVNEKTLDHRTGCLSFTSHKHKSAFSHTCMCACVCAHAQCKRRRNKAKDCRARQGRAGWSLSL